VGPTCQPAGEREKGGGTSPRGPKGKADRAGKKKKRGGGGEKRGGLWAERRKERGAVRFFSFFSNPFKQLFKPF
jgi:hypothetical protein